MNLSAWRFVVLLEAVTAAAYHGITQPQDSSLLLANTKKKIASSVAKSRRRAEERAVVGHRTLCSRCHRPPVQCLCHALPPQKIETRQTDILILQHPTEFRRKQISTVPLLSLVLEHVQVKVGLNIEDPEQVEPIRHALATGRKIWLLFPGEDAISLDQEEGKELVRRHRPQDWDGQSDDSQLGSHANERSGRDLLILMDGTWTQARRMARHSPKLLDLCQQVQFAAPESISIYNAIRQEPDTHCLSTLEACVLTLQLLEPDYQPTTSACEHLMTALQSLVDIQLRHSSVAAAGSQKSLEESQVSSPAIPRFVSRADKRRRKQEQRLEVEEEIFGGRKVEKPNDRDDVADTHSNTRASKMTSLSQENRPRQRDFVRELGDGAVLRPLELKDAIYVNSRWPHASKKSLRMIQQLLWKEIQDPSGIACCLGVEVGVEDDKKLAGCLVRYSNGALGMLHVDEEYRRRGYATALLREAMRQLGQLRTDQSKIPSSVSSSPQQHNLFAFIIDGNYASEAVFTKLGWVKEDPSAKKGTGRRRAPRKWIYLPP